MFAFYCVVFAAAFFATIVVLLGMCVVAPRLGLVDHPAGRKAHLRPTPVVGGLSIVAGTLIAVLVALALSSHSGAMANVISRHLGFVAGSLILLLMGLWDDHRPIPARYKLLIQMFCCTLAVFQDHNMVGDVGIFIGPNVYAIGGLAGPFSVLVMLTVTNAMNMIDGVDGLAGGITFVAFAVMAKALTAAGFTSAPYLIALIGGLGAFLVFNFPFLPGQKAKMFLGDSGSLLFGFAMGYMAIEFSAMPGRVFKPSTALWFFFIPVCDTIWLYLRRMIVARAPFAAGRDHIHHLLMERFSSRITSWILVGASAILAGGAYYAERTGVDNSVMILSWVGGFLAYGALTQKSWRRAWNRSRENDEPETDL
jgi:UDP-GlcNAc:undecaprenyl-phosphate GlcNAc-1-phosphate transferase